MAGKRPRGETLADLLARVFDSGDLRAYGRLIRRLNGLLGGVPISDREDVVHETLRVLAQMRSDKPGEEIGEGLIIRICQLRAVDQLRQRIRRPTEAMSGREMSAQPPPSDFTTLREVIGLLEPEDQRIVVGLLAGKPREAIAAELEVSTRTVDRRVERLRERLRGWLDLPGDD